MDKEALKMKPGFQDVVELMDKETLKVENK
jgi:hypothetical protein